jgi:hypothetical protein
MNKAVFIHRSGPQLASYRYRAEIPAKAIGGCVNGGEAGSVYIFSKPTPDDVTLAKECKAEGVKVVCDIGDDHFNHAVWGPVYREMVSLADCLVAPSENMAGRLMKYFNRTADAVIPDPYEEPLSAPHADGQKLLWYGHPVNLKDLKESLPALKNLALTIVTGQNHGLDHDYLQWSPEVQTRELKKANMVILPTRKGTEFKTANRLVNALRAGCFPVCGGHIPSYQEFRKVAWVGHFSTGLRWATAYPQDLNALVAEGQQYIEKFSPENIGKLWQQVVDALCQS